ncbi:(2Fe-2S)-binding protein [Kitasatospora mediocidica]|uniref:(2Fe-2S)-binding protein n=1 Tax=Kitasatospora mediocidica TaxID=58352 RepID=UPI000568888B|nr:(2Fe-2S)-binding protein [Kitasatospora mediocidica]
MPDTQQSLADGYRRLKGVCGVLRVSVVDAAPVSGPGREWLCVAELSGGIGLLIEAEARRIGAEHGCVAPPHVAASRLLHHYLWSACLLISGPWYLDGRVSWLRPEDVWIEVGSGDLAVRPADGREVCGEREGAGEEGLRAELRAAVAAHVAPVLEAFRPVVKRGDRALWGMVTDDLVSGIWYLGRMLGEEERAVAEATDLLPGGPAPFAGGAGFRRLPGTEGRSHLTRTRLGCCLYYTIRPADTCVTCPRTGDAERVLRLEA